MDYFATSASVLTALAAVVALLSRWAAIREEKLKERVVTDWKAWAVTDDGLYFFRGYIRKVCQTDQNQQTNCPTLRPGGD